MYSLRKPEGELLLIAKKAYVVRARNRIKVRRIMTFPASSRERVEEKREGRACRSWSLAPHGPCFSFAAPVRLFSNIQT